MAAAWAYEGAARALILALKVRGLRSAAQPLVAGMIGASRRGGLRGRVLTWVPGRSGDITARGFDHAEVLARGMARGLGLPVHGLLTRRAAARDQTLLSAGDRAANVRGAFWAARSPSRVVLVDDLITTGATAGSCAGALRAAGADGVELVVACRVA
ncbi:MAG: ComF family protein [Actinomycetota bacterium]|nr:ComF family protein [Actinomycetota bacterium]